MPRVSQWLTLLLSLESSPPRFAGCTLSYGVANLTVYTKGSRVQENTLFAMLPLFKGMDTSTLTTADLDRVCSDLFGHYQRVIDDTGSGHGSICAQAVEVRTRPVCAWFVQSFE